MSGPKGNLAGHVSPESNPLLPVPDRLRAIMAGLNGDDYDGWDARLFRDGFEAVSYDEQRQIATFELTVGAWLCNGNGNLHGGAASTILDNLTSIVLHKDLPDSAGAVSRTLTLTFLRPVLKGTKVRIECQILAAGKNLANAQGVIKSLDGKTCVICVHDLAIIRSPQKI